MGVAESVAELDTCSDGIRDEAGAGADALAYTGDHKAEGVTGAARDALLDEDGDAVGDRD